VSCEGVSRTIQRLLRSRGRSSRIHCVVFGYNKLSNNFQIFEHLPNGSACIEQNFICAGRGSDCVLGLIEGKLADISTCIDTAPVIRQALELSLRTDSRSGGKLRMAILSTDGQLKDVPQIVLRK
jgi:20S proteasome alpha/beta subunit